MTRCFCPSLVFVKSRSARSSMCTNLTASSTIFQSSFDKTPNLPVYGYRPVATTSLQVIISGRTLSVNTTDNFLAKSLPLISSVFCPSRTITPSSGFNWRIRLFNMVVFPAPLGPISVNISPFFSWNAISLIRGTP